MSEGIGGVTGQSPMSGSGPVKNAKGALALLLLAVFPQLIYLVFVLMTPLSFGYVEATFSGFTALLADGYLLAIYNLPMLVIAAITAFLPVKGPQDYFGGVVLIALALFAFYASSDLPGMRGFQFGPGTAPRLFGGVLLGLAVAVALSGFLFPGEPLQRYHLRGPFFVTLSIIAFAFTIRPLGLVIAAFSSFMIAALGSPEQRWLQTLIVGIAITAFCCFLFPYALGLPFQLQPRFMLQ